MNKRRYLEEREGYFCLTKKAKYLVETDSLAYLKKSEYFLSIFWSLQSLMGFFKMTNSSVDFVIFILFMNKLYHLSWLLSDLYSHSLAAYLTLKYRPTDVLHFSIIVLHMDLNNFGLNKKESDMIAISISSRFY